MVIIEKAILHILNFYSADAVYSDHELMPEDSTLEFLVKHIEKTINSQDAKGGVFYDDSNFQKLLDSYIKGEKEFIPFSKEIAKILADALSHAEEANVADIIVSQIRVDDDHKLVIFKCNSHQGYIHQVEVGENGKVQTGLVNNFAILPSLTQRVDEYAYIDLKTKEIKVKSRKYHIDGNQILLLPELMLECSPAPSPSETIKEINKVVNKVAEEFGHDKVAAAAAVKTYISEELKTADSIDPVEAGKKIFRDSPSMQQGYAEAIESSGYTTPVKVDQEATMKKLRKHKLATDTGIELTIPTDYFDSTEFVEFNQEKDGSMSITIKHIQNLKNK